MKNSYFHKISLLLTVIFLFSSAISVLAQEEDDRDLRPVRGLFESTWLIDNQTALVPYKGTFQFDINHKFGVMADELENVLDDFFGLYAPSNIRLGFNYVPVDRLMVGFGVSKTDITWDLNAKYALIRQAREGGSPIAITYFVNTAIETKTRRELNSDSDRFSYFHQLMLARKFSDRFSFQVAGSLSHFNLVYGDEEGNKKWDNDHVAVSLSSRYKLGSWVNFIANVDIPVTSHNEIDNVSNISFGIEMTSSSHQFQIFVTSFDNTIPQRNNLFNTNDFRSGEFLIGFNITRLWNF